MRFIYTLLLYVIAPFALLGIAVKGIRNPAYRERLGERFGFTRLRFSKSIWVHAVSVGEVQASIPVVRELLSHYPALPLVLTTATPTGAARVKAIFGDRVHHCYLPYDLPTGTRRFLSRISPCFGLVMETEIWPNLFAACRGRKIPLVIASARLSEKSVKRYRSFPFFGRALSGVLIAAQAQRDADRFAAIGASSSQIHVTGNVKFDLQVAPELVAKAEQLRSDQFGKRVAWVAASTHEGEESVVLDAHRAVVDHSRDALLVLVPRHPQRFAEVRSLLLASGFQFVSRSRNELVTADTQVLLVDTLGELMLFYAASDVAFVGGSLVPIGGHNLLEPAALGRPILIGPHNFNAPEIAESLLADRAAVIVRDASELAEEVVRLFAHPAERNDMGGRGKAVVESNRGAVAKVMELVGRVAGV
jgi:3-deoxy-D-manno-octulosonic-acid transferase